ncbi:MAG: lipoyl synthase [Spirochaetota bacterium]
MSGSGGGAVPAQRKPPWLRVRMASGDSAKGVSETLARHGLNTVCDEARCPNKGECWGQATATFMVMGSVCTRGCRFCAVDTAKEGQPLSAEEPAELASAIIELALRYAVITSVDRDELPDRGDAHFAACVLAIRARDPSIRIEVLAPDYHEGEIEILLGATPDVFAHNVETVLRLEAIRDRRAAYRTSLHTLSLASDWAKAHGGSPLVKSSLLLGVGEREEEVLAAMDDLREVGVTSLVLGQYLQPSARQIPVVEYVHPEAFASYAVAARGKGFGSVVSSPLARTSYHARSSFEESSPG